MLRCGGGDVGGKGRRGAVLFVGAGAVFGSPEPSKDPRAQRRTVPLPPNSQRPPHFACATPARTQPDKPRAVVLAWGRGTADVAVSAVDAENALYREGEAGKREEERCAGVAEETSPVGKVRFSWAMGLGTHHIG